MRDEGTISSLAAAVRSGDRSATSVVRGALDRARAAGPLRAFLELDEDDVLSQAANVDARVAAGADPGALAGVPIALKDNLCTAQGRTTCGSRMLEHFRSPWDATVVERLRSAGAILFGKTNLDEFAMGSSGENSAFGLTGSAWSAAHVPGGSSAGSATAVAAEIVPASLGSDTGGSIRQPASFSGIVGFKPTYGRVSRRGLVAFASSLDQIGPFARTVADALRVYEAISGHDPQDATSSTEPVVPLGAALTQGADGLRIGVSREYFGEGLDPEVSAATHRAIAAMESRGARVVEVDLPHTRFAVATYYIVATAEASSNLARYDGVRFGHRSAATATLHEMYARSRTEGFGAEVRRRIMLGTFVLSAGYYDAYYRKAQQVRTLLARDFGAAFEHCDVIATPTSPVPPFGVGDRTSDPLSMYLADIYTVSANLAGLPGISVPSALSATGLPIGIQFLAAPFREDAVFRCAAAWEDARGPFPRAPRAVSADGGES